jgi:hypothetical protein
MNSPLAGIAVNFQQKSPRTPVPPETGAVLDAIHKSRDVDQIP